MVLESPCPDLVIPDKPFATWMLEALEAHGDTVALVTPETGSQLTYSQMRQAGLKLANILWDSGLRKNHIVLMTMPIDAYFVPVFIGIAACGAVINFCKLGDDQGIISRVKDIKAFGLFTDDDFKLNLEHEDLESIHIHFTCSQIQQKLEAASENHNHLPQVSINPAEDPFLMINSSGTSGKSKGIVQTHRAVIANALSVSAILNLLPGDVAATIAPQPHAFIICTVIPFLLKGLKNMLYSSLPAENCVKEIKEKKIKWFGTTNLQVLSEFIQNCDSVKSSDVASLEFLLLTGKPFPHHLLMKASKALDCNAIDLYGLSEAMWVTFSCSVKAPRGSVGLLAPNVKVKVVDPETKQELGVNQHGEIMIKGPCVMKEYVTPKGDDIFVKEPSGWLHSGDIGYYDEKGFLYVLDRMKDIIKLIEGFSVYPSKLEAILKEHPMVKDAAVIGVRHQTLSELTKAFVVRENDSLTAEMLLEFFDERVIERESLTGGIEFIEKIPRAGKIQRRKLRELEQKRISSSN